MKKKLAIISVIIITILSIFNISKAESTETFELYLETNNKKIEPGKEFSADIILDNIAVTSGDQGIAGYTAKIVYDTNVLELVSVKSNDWEVMENEGNIIVNTKDAEVVKERTITAQATFKLKDSAKAGKTTINLDNIEGTSGMTTIKGTTRNLEMQIVVNKPNNDTNTSGNSVNGNNINTSKNAITGNVEKPSTSKQPSLPYAGVRNVVIGIAVVIAVIAIYFYIKYRRAYDEKK